MLYIARNILQNKHNCHYLFSSIGMEYVVFDVETTGLKTDKDYIVELAAIKYVITKDGAEEVDRMDLFLRPPFLMEQKVVNIHHITNEFLEDKPTEKECFDKIKTFFGPRPILVGHNIDFDIQMLSALYRRCNDILRKTVVLDTLEFARDMLNYKEVENYKLETLINTYYLNTGLNFHCALDDVIATSRLFLYLANEYEKIEAAHGFETVYVNYMYFWEGRNMHQTGVYLNTNLGLMYYSTVHKCWCSSQFNVKECNLYKLEAHILARTGLSSMKEFGRLTRKKFMDMKQSRRELGYVV